MPVVTDANGASADYQITIYCPSCQSPSTIRWDRLQPGKVLACRNCGDGFTSRPDGTLMSVEKGSDGKWRMQNRREPRWFESRRVAGSAATALLICIATFVAMRPAKVVQQELPEDLETRVQVFAEAWLKKDYQIIRRLTHPSHGPQLFAWHKKNPAPDSKQKVKINVEVVKDVPPVAMLVVRFDGLKPPESPSRELFLNWKEQNGEWLFLPTTETRISARLGAHFNLPFVNVAGWHRHDAPLDSRESDLSIQILLPANRILGDSAGVPMPQRRSAS